MHRHASTALYYTAGSWLSAFLFRCNNSQVVVLNQMPTEWHYANALCTLTSTLDPTPKICNLNLILTQSLKLTLLFKLELTPVVIISTLPSLAALMLFEGIDDVHIAKISSHILIRIAYVFTELLLMHVMSCCMFRLFGCHSMAQVMDPTQASCQIQLLTELHSRFPEVPVEVIKIIMHQVCSSWKVCVMNKFFKPVILCCHYFKFRDCTVSSFTIICAVFVDYWIAVHIFFESSSLHNKVSVQSCMHTAVCASNPHNITVIQGCPAVNIIFVCTVLNANAGCFNLLVYRYIMCT